MEGWHHGDASLVQSKLSAQLGDAFVDAEQPRDRSSAQRYDDLRPQEVELSPQVGRTGLHFHLTRMAVFRGTTFIDVSDVNVIAIETHCFDHLVEQYA